MRRRAFPLRRGKVQGSAVQRGDITGMSFLFSVDKEEWENLESEHPTRHILKIGTVVEVDIRGKLIAAEIVPMPFYKRP